MRRNKFSMYICEMCQKSFPVWGKKTSGEYSHSDNTLLLSCNTAIYLFIYLYPGLHRVPLAQLLLFPLRTPKYSLILRVPVGGAGGDRRGRGRRRGWRDRRGRAAVLEAGT